MKHWRVPTRLLAAASAALVGVESTAVDAFPYRPHWECVPLAREASGIALYGDAWTWWGQAGGRYARGDVPRKGAVLALKPHGAMTLGHVAVVSGIIDARTVLITHANWSPINGARGQIEENVRVIDVSPDNDWSAVRVWYAPMHDLGTTAWPAYGFIYPGRAVATPDQPQIAYTDVSDWQPRRSSRLDYLRGVIAALR